MGHGARGGVAVLFFVVPVAVGVLMGASRTASGASIAQYASAY
jgi:hypothetical protein